MANIHHFAMSGLLVFCVGKFSPKEELHIKVKFTDFFFYLIFFRYFFRFSEILDFHDFQKFRIFRNLRFVEISENYGDFGDKDLVFSLKV